MMAASVKGDGSGQGPQDFPLHKAVFVGDVEKLEALLKEHDVSSKDKHGKFRINFLPRIVDFCFLCTWTLIILKALFLLIHKFALICTSLSYNVSLISHVLLPNAPDCHFEFIELAGTDNIVPSIHLLIFLLVGIVIWFLLTSTDSTTLRNEDLLWFNKVAFWSHLSFAKKKSRFMLTVRLH